MSDEALGTALRAVWQQARDNHERYSATGSHEDDIRFMTLGMSGEAGEIIEALILAALVNKASGKAANLVKKRWRDGDDHANELQKEVADVCAYAFMLAEFLGMRPEDLIGTIAFKQQVFVEKMRARAGGQS